MTSPTYPPEFFLPDPQPTLSQGDIVLSPSTVLWGEDRHEVFFGPVPTAPMMGEGIVAPLWNPYDEADGHAPVVIHESRWSPVMVLSHDCELEKEFNRRVGDLMGAGMPEDDARREASEDGELDRFVVVAPVLPYAELSDDQHDGIRSGQRIGFFPVPFHPMLEEATFVHLDRACTVDRELLTRYEQIASLGYTAVGVLRYKLSECYAARDMAVISEIQKLVGDVVEHLIVLPRSKKASSLQLYLRSGHTVHLEIRKPFEGLREEIRRLNPFRRN